jgi:dihydroxyacetone kinase
VLALYGNYSGDRLNFDLAARMAQDIEVTSVRGADDVASAPPDAREERRGIAGLVFAYKTAGACAREGADLAEVTAVAERTTTRTRSMGVALSSCTLPTVGTPNFSVEAGQMELGMGIHGEPGVSAGPLRSADETADELWDRILADFDGGLAGSIAVLVNGLGATPLEELYIVYRRVAQRADEAGLRIAASYVGEYVTSMDMAGASLSVLSLDDELERLLASAATFWPGHFPSR